MHNLCSLKAADQAIGTFFVHPFSLLIPARVLCLIPTSISIHFHLIRKVIIMRMTKIYRKYCIVEHQIFRLFVLRYFLCGNKQVSLKPRECVSHAFCL